MEQVIEVRYAGIVVGQATAVRDRTATGVFVGVNDPMPVGTILTLKIGDQITDGRVEQVIESSEAAQAGMRVRFVDNRAAATARPSAAASAPPVSAAAAAPANVAPAPSAAVRLPPAAARVPPAAMPVTLEPPGPEQASTGAPSDESGEGESAGIPAASDLGESGPQNLAGGGGGRRRRRRR